MEWWQGYVSAALMGTDRRVPMLPKGSDKLSELVRSLDWREPAAALLSTASAVTQYRRVGQSAAAVVASMGAASSGEQIEPPVNGFAPLVVSEPDVLVCCRDRIARYFGIALDNYPEAIPELLELMASVKQRVPPKWLPKLLSFGVQNRHARAAIGLVLGNRGRWLAAQNPDWHYGCYTAEDEEAVDVAVLRQRWQSGEKAERILAFAQWRSVEPEDARAALKLCWKKESWREREAFISAFSTHLSLTDEDFLENALEDRAKGVRTQAATLLSQMPESALCQRMAQRVRSFVQIEQAGASLQIRVSLPEQYDKTWARDGIQQKPRNGEGERAGWVRQMLSKTPLSIWQADPEAIAAVAMSHEWREALVNGWAGAIRGQKKEQMAKGWARAWLNQCGAYDLDESVLSDLLLLLSPAQREAYLRTQLPRSGTAQSVAYWLRLVAQEPTRWDFEFSRLVLSQLMLLLQGQPKYGDLFSPPISLALSLHPGLAAEAQQRVMNLPQSQYWTGTWQKFLDRFLGLLNLRWEIYQAFADSS